VDVTLIENLCVLHELLGLTQHLFGEILRSVLCLVEQSSLEHFEKKGIPCCVITFCIAFLSCVLFHIITGFIFLYKFIGTLKNEFLNHQFFKSDLFSGDVNIPSVIHK